MWIRVVEKRLVFQLLHVGEIGDSYSKNSIFQDFYTDRKCFNDNDTANISRK